MRLNQGGRMKKNKKEILNIIKNNDFEQVENNIFVKDVFKITMFKNHLKIEENNKTIFFEKFDNIDFETLFSI
jgi:hypothetical protein